MSRTVGAKKTFPKLFIVHRSCSIRMANDMNDANDAHRSRTTFIVHKRRSSFHIILHVYTVYMNVYNYYGMYKYTCRLHVHICTLYTDPEWRSDYKINDDQSAASICCLQNVRIVHERHFYYKINLRKHFLFLHKRRSDWRMALSVQSFGHEQPITSLMDAEAVRLAQSLLLDAPGEPGHLTVHKAVTLAVFHSRSVFDCRQVQVHVHMSR